MIYKKFAQSPVLFVATIIVISGIASGFAYYFHVGGSQTQRVKRHSHYFTVTTPKGEMVECVALNQTAIDCDFPK